MADVRAAGRGSEGSGAAWDVGKREAARAGFWEPEPRAGGSGSAGAGEPAELRAPGGGGNGSSPELGATGQWPLPEAPNPPSVRGDELRGAEGDYVLELATS